MFRVQSGSSILANILIYKDKRFEIMSVRIATTILSSIKALKHTF